MIDGPTENKCAHCRHRNEGGYCAVCGQTKLPKNQTTFNLGEIADVIAAQVIEKVTAGLGINLSADSPVERDLANTTVHVTSMAHLPRDEVERIEASDMFTQSNDQVLVYCGLIDVRDTVGPQLERIIEVVTRQNKYVEYILFDRDGDPNLELETYEW